MISGIFSVQRIRTVALIGMALVVAVTASQVPATPAEAASKISKKVCRQFIVAGHRGKHYSAAKTNENTIKAFKSAKKDGAELLEIDSWNTVDGVPVVVHDPTWTRTIDPKTMTGVPALVKDTTYAQVKQLRTKGGEKVPTLEEAIKWAGSAKVTLMVEIKWTFTQPEKVAGWVKAAKAKVWFYQSPHEKWHNLTGVEDMQKQGMVTGVKMQSYFPMTPAELKKAGYKFVALDKTKITKTVVKQYHAKGIKVFPKNSSKKSEWRKIVKSGADGVIATSPAKLASWQAKGCK